MKAKDIKIQVIETFRYELQLNDGTRYRIECSSEELDKLIALIGEKNIVDVDEV